MNSNSVKKLITLIKQVPAIEEMHQEGNPSIKKSQFQQKHIQSAFFLQETHQE